MATSKTSAYIDVRKRIGNVVDVRAKVGISVSKGKR